MESALENRSYSITLKKIVVAAETEVMKLRDYRRKCALFSERVTRSIEPQCIRETDHRISDREAVRLQSRGQPWIVLILLIGGRLRAI